MSNTNTGGPAFPFEMAAEFDGVRGKGMTLRDYFAARSMLHFLQTSEEGYDEVAEDAYLVADAMLHARNAKA